MKKLIVVISTLLLFVFSATFVHAAYFNAGEKMIVSNPINDDAYVAGGVVLIEQEIKGDLYVAGGTVSVAGDVEGDLVVAGGDVAVYGNVGDDVRAAGGQVLLSGNVGDDVIIGSGKVLVDKNSTINGSLTLGGGYVEIMGNIKEDLKGGVGVLFLSGTVGRNVDLKVEDEINLTTNSKINGNLKYVGFKESKVPKGVVSGTIQFSKLEAPLKIEKDQLFTFLTAGYVTYKVYFYLSLLLLGLLYILFMPKHLIKTTEKMMKNTGRSLGVGLLTLVLAVIVGCIALFTVIGMPISFIIFTILGIVWFFAKVVSGFFVGSLIFSLKSVATYSKGKLFGVYALGLFIFELITIVPILGWIAGLIVMLLALGGLMLVEKDMLKVLRTKNYID